MYDSDPRKHAVVNCLRIGRSKPLYVGISIGSLTIPCLCMDYKGSLAVPIMLRVNHLNLAEVFPGKQNPRFTLLSFFDQKGCNDAFAC